MRALLVLAAAASFLALAPSAAADGPCIAAPDLGIVCTALTPVDALLRGLLRDAPCTAAPGFEAVCAVFGLLPQR